MVDYYYVGCLGVLVGLYYEVVVLEWVFGIEIVVDCGGYYWV